MAKQLPVGIDLGTTYSAVAVIGNDDGSRLIVNAEGDLLTPSVVLFDDDDVIVGKEAKRAASLFPDRVAENVKRDMGCPEFSQRIRGQCLPPEVIQSCILRKLRLDIMRRIGPQFRVVITVPAFFDEPRRRATALAGEIAGLDVLDILNEPTAAALAFGEQTGFFRNEDLPNSFLRQQVKSQTVLVYDLGGGTFDVTLLEIQPLGFRTLATDGDVFLGGRDWDQKLADHAAEHFIRQFQEDPRKNASSFKRLMVEAERAKHTLSTRNRTEIRVEHAGQVSEIQVTRALFDELSSDLLERTAHTTKEVLSQARVEWRQVDHVLMVGGSSRMPMVSKLLEKLSGKTPNMVMNPDEAVARGAAIYASFLLSRHEMPNQAPNFRITNVNSHCLGIAGVDESTDDRVNAILIPRNSPLPAKATRTFVTKKPNQRSINIRVLEGESPTPEDCTIIGDTSIRNLPPNLPKGHKVEVTYEYAPNGRLRVFAEAVATSGKTELEILRLNALADQGIARWKKTMTKFGGWSLFVESISSGGRTSSVEEPLVDLELVDEPADKSSGPSKSSLSEATRTGQEMPPSDSIQKDGRESVQPPSALPEARSRSWRAEFAKIILGALVGAVLSQGLLWWVFRQDPLGLASKLPKPLQSLAPESLRKPNMPP